MAPNPVLRFRAPRAAASLLAAGLLFSGCATLPSRPPDLPVMTAWPEPASTPLGRALARASSAHPGQSGFELLPYGEESLLARIALADAAQRTLDLQYYIYEDGRAAALLTAHLLQAADRGVRVRLLLDGYNLTNERELAALCANPRFQVRVFNPLPSRSPWARVPEFVFTLPRSDRRMHDKLFVADNAVSILGGRNIGDDYFNLGTQGTFRDFDLLIAGELTGRASVSFDLFWNSSWTVPLTALVAPPSGSDGYEQAVAAVRRRALEAADFERRYDGIRASYLAHLESSALIWAPGEILAEPPPSNPRGRLDATRIARRLDEQLREAKSDVQIEAAYLLPAKEGLAAFRSLCQRGVPVRLLTSALATTDVPIVYTAYEKRRRDLLSAGVQLYEYRVHPPGPRLKGVPWYRVRPGYSILHSKVMVFDHRRVWVGSFNLDPRSSRLNTEIVALVDSPALAAQLSNEIAGDLDPTRSWRLSIEPGDGHRVIWTGVENGRSITRFREPASLGQRLDALLLSVLPGLDGEL